MSILKRIYKKLIPAGSSFQFFLWKYRHLIDKNFSKGELSEDDLNHPHRIKLMEMLKNSQPFESVLEVGCGKGTNLFLIYRHFPLATLTGLDINKNNVKYAKAYSSKLNINHTHFVSGNICKLSDFNDNAFDIVICDAILIYVDSGKIGKVADELKRITRKKIILVEFHQEDANEKGYEHNKCWVRNYSKLFPEYQTQITNIDSGTWTEQWETYGRFIEISTLSIRN